MSLRDSSDIEDFHIDARGGQWWGDSYDRGRRDVLLELSETARQHFKKVVPKRRFVSEAEARAFQEAHAHQVLDVYQCEICGDWHLATQRGR